MEKKIKNTKNIPKKKEDNLGITDSTVTTTIISGKVNNEISKIKKIDLDILPNIKLRKSWLLNRR